MKTNTTFIVIAFALFGCSSGAVQDQSAPLQLPVETVAGGAATTYQEFPATIQGKLNIDIRPQVEGRLARVFVDEGEYVNRGDRLFLIDPRPFDKRLVNARATAIAAQGSLSNAKLEVERLTPLVENKVVSDYQLKAAKATLQIAEGSLLQAKAQVGIAEIDLGYTVIEAPESGYIGLLPKKQGSLISPNDPVALTQLSDIRDIRAYFSLAENDFAKFRSQYPGKTLREKIALLPPVALILPDKTEYGIRGKVDMIDGQFDQNTAAITFRATFPNTEGLLRSGNTGKIRMSLRHDDILQIPVSATIELQDKTFVYAVGDSNKVKRQAVRIIGKSGNSYLIDDGLQRGARIVVDGLDRLQEGAVIVPQKPVRATTPAEK